MTNVSCEMLVILPIRQQRYFNFPALQSGHKWTDFHWLKTLTIKSLLQKSVPWLETLKMAANALVQKYTKTQNLLHAG